jgi:hypothetical protein
MTEDHDVRQLLEHLSQIEPLYWIRNAPELFTWAAFTGAAASKHQDTCVTFISKAGTVLTAIENEDLTLIRQGWRYYRLLKRLGGDDNVLAVSGDGWYKSTGEWAVAWFRLLVSSTSNSTSCYMLLFPS